MVYNTPYQELFNAREGHVFMTSGLFGGYPGSTGYRHSIKKTDVKERIEKQLPYPIADQDSENSQMEENCNGEVLKDQHCYHHPDPHEEYDMYLSVISGGHGLGDVLERDPALVIQDLNEGLLLERTAAPIYGVVATQGADGKWVLDAQATEAKRAEIRKQRLARSMSVEEWKAQTQPKVEKMDFIYPVRRMYAESSELSEKWRREFNAFWDLDADFMPSI